MHRTPRLRSGYILSTTGAALVICGVRRQTGRDEKRCGVLRAMNPWFAKVVVLLASIVMVVIRAPHGQRSRAIPVAKSRKGALEIVLLTIAWVAFFLTLIWIATPAFAFADYPLHPVPLLTGTLLLAFGLWLFHRSHADLGANWSLTLELREKHQLVTHGVYRLVCHPMYLALLIYS